MTYEAGMKLGNYRLIRLLGHGGFANVYLGEHMYLKTQAAIKVLQLQLNESDREDFLHEARTIAHLIHPHIIRVLDFGVEGYTPYLVMDYAANGSLRERYPNGTRLIPEILVPYVKQVASALQYAHKQNFIHRDVKPANMLLGKQDEVLLSDFGTALIAQTSHSQSTQETVGTVSYMAPEQIEGKPRPASDQYSLGICVYEWLCGERPFRGSLTEIVTQQLASPPPSLRSKIPSISPAIEEAVMVALAKDPRERFATVEAFANALEQAVQAEQPTFGVLLPIPPSPPTYSQTEIMEPAPYLKQPAKAQVPQQQSGMAGQQLEIRPPASDNYRRQRTPTEPPHSKLTLPTGTPYRERSGWSTGIRQILSMIFGVVLYSTFGSYMDILLLHHKDFASYALFSLSVVIPLFFGIIFGPWVGLVTGGAGYFLGHFLSHTSAVWSNGMGLALTGFIAGLALLRTRGYYKSAKAIAIAMFFCFMGVLVGEGFADCSSIGVLNYDTGSAASNFVIFSLLELLFALILLPILLAAYNLIAGSRKRE